MCVATFCISLKCIEYSGQRRGSMRTRTGQSNLKLKLRSSSITPSHFQDLQHMAITSAPLLLVRFAMRKTIKEKIIINLIINYSAISEIRSKYIKIYFILKKP